MHILLFNFHILPLFSSTHIITKIKYKISYVHRPDFTTQIGFIKCGLQTVATNVRNKDEFCINMLRGFASTMEIDTRNEFANKVRMQI